MPYQYKNNSNKQPQWDFLRLVLHNVCKTIV